MSFPGFAKAFQMRALTVMRPQRTPKTFAGQGIAALQTTGLVPIHPARLPHVPALGVYPTIETYAVQGTLIALALAAFVVLRAHRTPPAPPGATGDPVSGSREGAKL